MAPDPNHPQTTGETAETIIRFSHTWWMYMIARGGFLRGMVNGLEDTLAITGRMLLLIFLLYCGVKSGALLVTPDWKPSIWLEMSMFVLQLAGLEGSVPGLARRAESLRTQKNDDGATRVERVMLNARIMTILTIGEGVLHLFGIDPQVLRVISGVLLLVRGVVITSFLIELAKIESAGPRILSRDEHDREEQAMQIEGEQALQIEALQEQLQHEQHEKEDLTKQLAYAHYQTRIATDLQVKIDQTCQSQASVLADLKAQIARMDQEKQRVSALLENAEGQITDLTTTLEYAETQIADLSNNMETANGQAAQLQERLQYAEQEKEEITTQLATAEKQMRIVTDLHIQTDQINQNQARLLTDLQVQLSQADQEKHHLGADLQTAHLQIEELTADLQTAHLQITDLQTAHTEAAKMQQDYQVLTAHLQTAHLQIIDLTGKLERAKNKIAELQGGTTGQTGPSRSTKTGGQPAEQKITSIDEARAKHDGGQGRAKVSHAEVVAYMTLHTGLKRSEVAEQLGISERKVYDAISWAKDQEQEHAASDR